MTAQGLASNQNEETIIIWMRI